MAEVLEEFNEEGEGRHEGVYEMVADDMEGTREDASHTYVGNLFLQVRNWAMQVPNETCVSATAARAEENPARRAGKEPMSLSQQRRLTTLERTGSKLRTPTTSSTEPMTERYSEPTAALAPLSLWTTTQEGKSKSIVANANIATVMDENIKKWIHRELRTRHHEGFTRKAWM